MKKLFATITILLFFVQCTRDSNNVSDDSQSNSKKYVVKISTDQNSPYGQFFEYSNKLIKKIIIKEQSAITTINIGYDNLNKLNALTLDGPNVSYNTQFFYNNDKLISIKKTYNETNEIMSAYFEYNSNNKLSKIFATNSNGYSETLNIIYEGNIIKTYTNNPNDYTTFYYDNKNSPYKNVDKNIILSAFVIQGEIFANYLNTENNLVKEVSPFNEIIQNKIYDYDVDNFPTKMSDIKNSYSLIYLYNKF